MNNSNLCTHGSYHWSLLGLNQEEIIVIELKDRTNLSSCNEELSQLLLHIAVHLQLEKSLQHKPCKLTHLTQLNRVNELI